MNTRTRAASVLLAGGLALTACSSSSGTSSGSASVDQIATKLKADPQTAALKTQLGSRADRFDALITCLAQVIKKDAKPADVQAYVRGTKTLQQVSGNDTKAKADAKACATTAVKSS